MSNYYYLDREQKQQGPFTQDEMQTLLNDLRIGQQTLVFREGDTKWRTAHLFPELATRVPSIPKPIQTFSPVPGTVNPALGVAGNNEPLSPVAQGCVFLVCLIMVILGIFFVMFVFGLSSSMTKAVLSR